MVKLAKPQTSYTLARHLLWAAMQKIGQKELDSGKLPQSTSHSVNLKIHGTIDGRPISESIESMVSIGESQTKSSSVNPQMPELVAWILGKLNSAGMPDSNEMLVNESNDLLKKLRQTRTVNARASIRCQYVIKEPSRDPLLTR